MCEINARDFTVSEYNQFICDFYTESVSNSDLCCQMVEWLMNNALEGMWKAVVVA